MTATPDRISADRARLAELEAEFAENPRGLYVAQNLETARRRVARHDAHMPAPPPAAATSSPPAPAPVATIRHAAEPSREEALRAIGVLMGATAEEVEAACQSETTPSAFLHFLTATTAVERVAKRIATAGTVRSSNGKDADPNSVDAIAARIAAA